MKNNPTSKSKHPIEVEFRARFDKDTYDGLMQTLMAKAQDLGEDDKLIHFFPLKDKLIKVTANLTKGTAKVSFKGGRIGSSDKFTEIEYPIALTDVDKAVEVFLLLGHGELYHTAENTRHNFSYREVEIALKYSQAWGHHAEFEVMLLPDATDADFGKATELIESVASDLGVRLMTREDLAEFERQFEESQKQK